MANDSASASTSEPAATTSAPTTFPTDQRQPVGVAQQQGAERAAGELGGDEAMNVTNTKKPTNEAPTAKASVPPASDASPARVVPPPAVAGPLSRAGGEHGEGGDDGEGDARCRGEDDGAPAQQALQLGLNDADHHDPPCVLIDEGQ